MARSPRGKSRRSSAASSFRRLLPWLGFAAVLSLCALVVYGAYLDSVIRARFEGQLGAAPARVYARPLELFAGARVSVEALTAELRRLGYRRADDPGGPGRFRRDGARVDLVTRRFTFPDGVEPSRAVTIRFRDGRISAVRGRERGREISLMRLEPERIGSIYPRHGEDRVPVALADLPELLREGLVLAEDRRFRNHIGVDPIAIGRALIANLRAGEIVEGGSTLTQQLVRSYFLSNRQTLVRKLNEALMAMLLDVRYSKDEILRAYVNEAYLGQAGDRAVHGFGLASRFYFGKPAGELEAHESALLVALVRGPSYYDPRRHPERARQRRNLILDIWERLGALSATRAQRARGRPLGVTSHGARQADHPAFLQLVRERLLRDYREADLTSGGLRIFTTLDPGVQAETERAVQEQLPRLGRRAEGDPDALQAAAVVTDTDSAEVLALVGGRNPDYAGFNRAVDAQRPVGSLIKPAVYLTALERPRRYHLATMLADEPVEHRLDDGNVWRPGNYSGEYHGDVPLYRALAQSYNAATARLGLAIGVPEIAAALDRLGMPEAPEPYPSLLLGAVEMSPLTVTRMYQTIASGGFRSRLRTIREVTTSRGEALKRYPISLDRAVDPGPNYLIVRALQEVARRGTARDVYQGLPRALNVAAKTGTTDGYRDSWFAGFTGSRLAVTWVGRDDNRSTGLTGAAGALRIWRGLMARLEPLALEPERPESIVLRTVHRANGLLADAGCPQTIQLPFIEGSVPQRRASCADGGSREGRDGRDGAFEWLKRWFR